MKIWHPFTQEKTSSSPITISRGEGAYLYSNNGQKYLDLISSWWANIHGHANEEIADAIHEQAKKLEHVIFAGYSHEPAENLCTALSRLLPTSLDTFFFSDDGSTTVEVAMKMAYQYFKNINDQSRNMFINFRGAYHGDTLGAMSAAGQSSEYHRTFSEFFFDVFSINTPEYYVGCEDIEEKESLAISELSHFLENNAHKVCALIVEPLVQGAAGMKMHRAEFLEKVVEIVRSYNILIIFDEVMTGFCRTQRMFAMDHLKCIPDFLCISKGITGGFLPLALTVTTQKIYDAFLDDDVSKAFLHGHTYTANPIACAAACKSLEILQRKSTQNMVKSIADVHEQYKDHFNEFRNLGTIAAFRIDSPKEVKELLAAHNIISRPIGNNFYMLPPYCITTDELHDVYRLLL